MKCKNKATLAIMSVVSATIFTGCGILGLSDKEIAKYYQATDLVNAANTDFGDTYDKVIDAYFNVGIDYDSNIKLLEDYCNSGLISDDILNDCKSYKDYTDSMTENFHVDYKTNGNPKVKTESDMSDVFSMIEQLERGWIGAWMYAIPEDDMNNVLNAYYNNNLLLNFDDGTYSIVDYQTDVYGNAGGTNDFSRKLNPEVPDTVYDTDSQSQEDEYADYMDENDSNKYDKYTITGRSSFSNFIVYKVVNPRTQKSSNFTAVISNGMVVSIDGGFTD